MTITSFEFTDKFRDWKLTKTNFSNFNLLVGLSGVGKTRILNALEMVCDIGLDRSYANGCQWTLELQIKDRKFVWQAETSIVQEARYERDADEVRQTTERLPRFLLERIIRDGEILVDRNESQFIFQNDRLPKLKNTESAISLLSDEETIEPLHQAISKVTFFDEAVSLALLPFDTAFIVNNSICSRRAQIK